MFVLFVIIREIPIDKIKDLIEKLFEKKRPIFHICEYNSRFLIIQTFFFFYQTK